MNSKDYKAIAEIIRNLDIDDDRLAEKKTRRRCAERLADYFEKEVLQTTDFMKAHPRVFEQGEINTHKFDRQQFLKDCGVE